MALTREQIMAADDIPKPKEFEVPEWKGSVFLRLLDVGERGEWEAKCFDDDGKPKIHTRTFQIETLVCMVCNEQGVPIFKPEDVKVVAKKHPEVVERVAIEALKFNKLDLTSAEESGKNSREAQKRGSKKN